MHRTFKLKRIWRSMECILESVMSSDMSLNCWCLSELDSTSFCVSDREDISETKETAIFHWATTCQVWPNKHSHSCPQEVHLRVCVSSLWVQRTQWALVLPNTDSLESTALPLCLWEWKGKSLNRVQAEPTAPMLEGDHDFVLTVFANYLKFVLFWDNKSHFWKPLGY